MNNEMLNGWFPESECPGSLETFLAGADYVGEYPWNKTDKPPVIRWEDFRPKVEKDIIFRDAQRADGICHWPWEIAKYKGIPWIDPDQNPKGTCAGFSANNAVQATLLQHIADGVNLQWVPANPYPAWVLGRQDANYKGGGASMSMVLNGVNKYGRFPESVVGTYKETLQKGNVDWRKYVNDAEKFQAGCCYLGNLESREMGQAIVDCLKAGYKVSFGGSVAVSDDVYYVGRIKTADVRGSWGHAVAFVAYRMEPDGSEYVAMLNSWGNWYDVGKFEKCPGSVVWIKVEGLFRMCQGRYRDAFVITYAESSFNRTPNWNPKPIRISYPV